MSAVSKKTNRVKYKLFDSASNENADKLKPKMYTRAVAAIFFRYSVTAASVGAKMVNSSACSISLVRL